MEFQYYGANCVRISNKKASIIIDDNLSALGAKTVTKPGEVVLFTAPHKAAAAGTKIVIDKPGEYEASNVSIQGIGARAHMDEAKQKAATMYRLVVDDVRIAVVGHVYPELSSSQLEDLSTIDVLIIPVGGNGYTLDPVGAHKLIQEIQPKLVIPTHYDEKGLNFEVPQQTLTDALKGLSMEVSETVPKLKVKAGELGDIQRLIVLEKQ